MLMVGGAPTDPAGSPVVLEPGPDYPEMHDQGWMTSRSIGEAADFEFVGIPGAVVHYGGALRLTNNEGTPQLVSIVVEQQGEGIVWTVECEDFSWDTDASSQSPTVMLAPQEQRILNVTMDWRDTNAAPTSLHLRVTNAAVNGPRGDP